MSKMCEAILKKTQNTSVSDKHPKYKTIPCKFWQKGNCLNGNQCTFIHDIHDNNIQKRKMDEEKITSPQEKNKIKDDNNDTQ